MRILGVNIENLRIDLVGCQKILTVLSDETQPINIEKTIFKRHELKKL